MTDKIAIDFKRFHAKNPHVYDWFDKYARQLVEASLKRGLKHGSATIVYERIRWQSLISTDVDGPIKLSNNYRPLYARLWEEYNPKYAGFFRKRRRQSETLDSQEPGEDVTRRWGPVSTELGASV